MNSSYPALALVIIITAFVAGGIFIKLQEARAPEAPVKTQEVVTAPQIKITDPQRGPDDAPITILYYTDFGCDACANMPLMISTLESDPQFAGKLKFVWKDFPVHENVFPETKILHAAARCAASAGKFWEFQLEAFKRVANTRLNIPQFDEIAKASGFEPEKLRACALTEGPQSLVSDSKQEALDLKLVATPTLYIMGTDKRYDGLPPYHVLTGTLRSILAERTQNK